MSLQAFPELHPWKDPGSTTYKLCALVSGSVVSDSLQPFELSMGFSKQESWSGLPFPLPGDLPSPGIELMSPLSPELQVDSLSLTHQGSPYTL